MRPINVFSNGEFTVTFDAKRCVNSNLCAKGITSVIKNSINRSKGENDEEIIDQIRMCPSGALSVTINKKELAEAV